MRVSSLRAAKPFFASAFVLAISALSAHARPVPLNMTNGLDKIVENRLLKQGEIYAPHTESLSAEKYTSVLAREAAVFEKAAITDAKTGTYLVDIMPDGTVSAATLRSALTASFPTMKINAVDEKYATHGVIEAFISVDDARGIAKFNGVRSVVLQLKPVHNVGLTSSQGINQHRVNRVSTIYNAMSKLNYDGTGMSIGVMSDSYDSQPSEEGGSTTAAVDVQSGDLPGAGNATNSQPVVVLEDYNPTPGATNEGRGMCQIVADMAPKARIGFATADLGEVEFAHNIRALAGLKGSTFPAATQQGFKADVVCDDVSYLDEPMYQDGIVAQGVIDAVDAGVSYCSSAANNYGTDGYSATFRRVANGTGTTSATNSALKNTNIDLTGVDPSLYAGGFHNFNPNGLDVAQLFNTGGDPQAAVFQWNDPYDTSAPKLGAVVFGPVTGDSTAGMAVDYKDISFTGGEEFVIIEKATPANQTENFDAIIDIIDQASGKTILSQDTGTDETVDFFAPATGKYTIHVHPFSTPSPVGGPAVPTMGNFSLVVNKGSRKSGITQDFNLLFFDTTGKFISAVASNNFASNRPIEVFVPTFNADGNDQIQIVISRANTVNLPHAATQFKYVFFGNGLSGIGAAEYNNYLTPVTFGHSAAAGANSVAAYSMFRPNLPEDFTSPGPVEVYFNVDNSRLAKPQIRRKPDIAAADGANNTFFPLGAAQDVPFDMDTQYPNFYGTSAASPHAAAIAALVIQAHKPAVLTPLQVKTIMQLSGFPHDLDPFYSSGYATTSNGGKINIAISSDNDTNTGTGSKNPNTFSVKYTGPGYLKTLLFNPEGTGVTGGNPTGGNFTGMSDADFLDKTKYNFTPGMVFNNGQFVKGTAEGLAATDVTATFTNAAPLPSTNAFFWTLNLTAADNKFTTGKVFRFNCGRNQQQDAQTPTGMTMPSALYGQTAEYSADILGNGLLIPEYADTNKILPGMTFKGTVVDGGKTLTFSGRIFNKVERGYSPLDGYGFVNAEMAVSLPIPVRGAVSSKVHGDAGPFEVALPLTGDPGIECRVPGPNNSYQLIFTFIQSVVTTGTSKVESGTAQIASTVLGPKANQVTVNLTGVKNAQHVVVSVTGPESVSGIPLGVLEARMDVLVGDVTANGATEKSDATVVTGNIDKKIVHTNFRNDVNASGVIGTDDVTVVNAHKGTKLP